MSWIVYRIEMPTHTRAEYLVRGTAEMREMARALVVLGDEACTPLRNFAEREEAEDFARAEFDRSAHPCLVRLE